MTTRGPEREQEFRDIRCSHSEGLPALLAQLRLSVLISTYQTGHLVVVAARQGRLVLTFHQFERAMGVAVKPGTIAVCTRKEVWFLRDAPDIAAKLPPPGPGRPPKGGTVSRVTMTTLVTTARGLPWWLLSEPCMGGFSG